MKPFRYDSAHVCLHLSLNIGPPRRPYAMLVYVRHRSWHKAEKDGSSIYLPLREFHLSLNARDWTYLPAPMCSNHETDLLNQLPKTNQQLPKTADFGHVRRYRLPQGTWELIALKGRRDWYHRYRFCFVR